MIPNIIYPALVAELGFTRVYRDFAGDAPVTPYAVWTPLAVNPHNNLDRANADVHAVSVDVFSRTQQESDALIRKARDAMEAIGYVETIQSLGYDSVTRLWRYSLTAEIQVNRPN